MSSGRPLLRRLAEFCFRGYCRAPINQKGGPLRLMVQRVAHTPVHGMEIEGGRWWAHTAWGYHPVQHYLERAHQQKKEIGHAPQSA